MHGRNLGQETSLPPSSTKVLLRMDDDGVDAQKKVHYISSA